MPQPQIYELNLTPQTQTVQITAITCKDLSLFKEILKEYRKLDDTIVMRLNRANARMRDRNRHQTPNTKQTLQDQACDTVWRELVANWTRRSQLIGFCVDVVDQSLAEKQMMADEKGDQNPALKAKHRHIYNELSVEDIVRRRSIAAFRSRCQYFVPPMTDAEARKMWDTASG